MLTEMHGKGGQICEPARLQQLRCPLIIRSTSEDVITGELVQVMRIINPRWWLPGFLNAAVGAERFRTQVFRDLRIEPWVNQPPYPRNLLPWTEGSTQVDVQISWENPPTTVFLEAKYLSDLSWKTTHSTSSSKYPGDQLIRNIRVGLHHCGYFRGKELFDSPLRDFVVVVLSPMANHALVRRYRSESKVRAAIPRSDLIANLPRLPFVGESNYLQIRTLLQTNKRFMTRAERVAAEELDHYLQYKKGPAMLANGNGNGFHHRPPDSPNGSL
jgi:hypothetical protein